MYVLARLAGLRSIWSGLDESDLDPDPRVQFQRWFRLARRVRIPMPHAMTLSTADEHGEPSGRIVLLKDADEHGFVFYTNYESRKARDLATNPRAALTMYWPGLERQVRIAGAVAPVSREQSEAYFGSRPRGSRLSAWASHQSEPAEGRDELMTALARVETKFDGRDVPCPPFWGGYRVTPDRMEFWQGRAFRLHDRFLYVREGSTWRMKRLHP